MSGYLQRLVERAAPASAGQPAPRPVLRSGSPLAQHDQRLHDPSAPMTFVAPFGPEPLDGNDGVRPTALADRHQRLERAPLAEREASSPPAASPEPALVVPWREPAAADPRPSATAEPPPAAPERSLVVEHHVAEPAVRGRAEGPALEPRAPVEMRPASPPALPPLPAHDSSRPAEPRSSGPAPLAPARPAPEIATHDARAVVEPRHAEPAGAALPDPVPSDAPARVAAPPADAIAIPVVPPPAPLPLPDASPSAPEPRPVERPAPAPEARRESHVDPQPREAQVPSRPASAAAASLIGPVARRQRARTLFGLPRR